MNAHPHRRLNPLTGEWVLVSPRRADRPWQGQVEEAPAPRPPAHDPACHLCPGNRRAAGPRNPDYAGTLVFDNDFAALRPDTPEAARNEEGLLVAESEPGLCRVVCYSPRHDLALGRLDAGALRAVVDTWAAQTRELGALPFIRSVQVFENRGAMMGASSPHPHGQIWASAHLPNELRKEDQAQTAHLGARGTCLLCHTLRLEREAGERVVCRNHSFTALVPFWAVWPFETLLVGERHLSSLDELLAAERDALADILRDLLGRYDALFGVPLPYSMGFHQAPTDGQDHPAWHLHAHFYPPLLRSATVRKFMVGYELLAGPQRDLAPEEAAARLREAGG